MNPTPLKLGYQTVGNDAATAPATSTYTYIPCVTNLTPPKRSTPKVSTPCLTDDEDDHEPGASVTSAATFSLKHKTGTATEVLTDLADAKTLKQWVVEFSDLSVVIFDGYLGEAGAGQPQRNQSLLFEFNIEVTRWWGFYATHPS